MKLNLSVRDIGAVTEHEIDVTTPADVAQVADDRATEIMEEAYRGEEPGPATGWYTVEVPEDVDLTELAEFLGDMTLRDFLASLPEDEDCSIDILTPEPECPEADKHEWTREHEGGCAENPGCWDLGNGRMQYVDHCAHCGMRRERVSLYAAGNSMRSAGVPDESVEYGEPDPDWVAQYIGAAETEDED